MTLDEELEQLRGAGMSEGDLAQTLESLRAFDDKPENYSNLNPDVGVLPDEEPFEFDSFQAAANIIPSAGRLAWDTTYPARHPVKTIEGALDLGSGILEKLGLKDETTDTKTVEAVGRYLSDRYGGQEEVLRTLQDDPAGMLSDITAILHGGGRLAQKAGISGAGAVADVAKAVDPINVGLNTAKAGIKAVASKTDPIGRMESAAKFSTILDEKFGVGERRRLAEILLREKIGLNYEGTVDLENFIKGLNKQVEEVLANNAGNVPQFNAPSVVTKHIPKLKDKWGADTQATGLDNTATIDKVVEKWKKSHRNKGSLPWSLNKLQKFKKNMYNQADYNVAPKKKTPIQNEAYKDMGRAAKETIEEAVPEVKDLNKRLGDAYALRPALIRSSGRIGNRDLSGIATPIKSGAGAQVGEALLGDVGAGLGAAYGFAAGITDAPLMKAKIAQGLWNAQQRSYGDVYRSSGNVPTMLRNITREAGQSAQGLDEENLLNLDLKEQIQLLYDWAENQ